MFHNYAAKDYMSVSNSSDSPCGRTLLRPSVIMNSDRTPGGALVRRNTEPLDLSAANSTVRSLKVISLKGPLPRTASRRMCYTTVALLTDRVAFTS